MANWNDDALGDEEDTGTGDGEDEKETTEEGGDNGDDTEGEE